MDTLDYAVYGTKYSLLTLAQRSAHDILDKIAVATSDYYALPSPKGASFAKAWYKQSSVKKVEDGQSPQWVDQLKTEIEDGNVALIALSEVAQDVVENDGYLRQKHLLRRAATHRFLVLHDIGPGDYRTNACVEHLNLDQYETHVIQTLQLVRAALIYFVEMIMRHEHSSSNNSDGPIPSLCVPTHHQIRGEG